MPSQSKLSISRCASFLSPLDLLPSSFPKMLLFPVSSIKISPPMSLKQARLQTSLYSGWKCKARHERHTCRDLTKEIASRRFKIWSINSRGSWQTFIWSSFDHFWFQQQSLPPSWTLLQHIGILSAHAREELEDCQFGAICNLERASARFQLGDLRF